MKVLTNFIYLLALIVMPNMAFAEHFKDQAYIDRTKILVNRMLSQADADISGNSTKTIDTSKYERIRSTQELLNKVGLNVGPEDGIWGPKTETALVKYLDIRGIDFDGKLDSNELQILNIATTKETNKKRKVFYFGFGNYGNEPWSTSDAKEVGKALEIFYPNRNVIQFVFSSDENKSMPITYPHMLFLNRPIKFARSFLREKDLVVIGFYSHGNRESSTVTFGKYKKKSKHNFSINPEYIKNQILKPLGHKNVAIIISSCYSGPFGEKLQSPNVLVATAAADTPSFGCSPTSKGTEYVGALQNILNQSKYQAKYNLSDAFKDTQKLILKLETSRGEKKPSNPQVFEGTKFFD